MRFPKTRVLYKVVKITNLWELAVIFAQKQQYTPCWRLRFKRF